MCRRKEMNTVISKIGNGTDTTEQLYKASAQDWVMV